MCFLLKRSNVCFFIAFLYIFVCGVVLASEASDEESFTAVSAYERLGISWWQKNIIMAVGMALSDEHLEALFSSQYDYLNENATVLKSNGFFPSEPKNYKTMMLSHQLPFFRAFFDGTLSVKQLELFKKAHARRTITEQDFSEMTCLIEQKFKKDHPWVACYLFSPKRIIEKFKPFVVTSCPGDSHLDDSSESSGDKIRLSLIDWLVFYRGAFSRRYL